MNLINHIGNKVTVWTKEGNSLENRTLITADEMGIVVSGYQDDREVFIPWCRVKYVDLIKTLNQPSPEFAEKLKSLVDVAMQDKCNKLRAWERQQREGGELQ